MSLIRKHVAVLQAWACLALVFHLRGQQNVCRTKGDVFAAEKHIIIRTT